MMSALGIAAILVTATSSLPQDSSDLHPLAQIQTRWTEQYERKESVSGPSLLARAGIFPQFGENLSAGLQLSTIGGSTSSFVSLSNNLSTKELGLHQAFIELHFDLRGDSENSMTIRGTALLGKFATPTLSSPLLWSASDEITPEGLFTSLEFSPISSFRLAIYGGQYSIHQTLAGLSTQSELRRSWLFQQGFYATYDWNSETDIKFALNHYHYLNPSTELAKASESRGNTVVDSQFVHSYSPVEFILSAGAKPLGIHTAVSAALALNPRTPDQQRGFYLETRLGNVWQPRNFSFQLSYYYNEPDMTVALFADEAYGSANRKGQRGEISYFILKNLRLATSFLYAEILAASAFQAARKEFRLDVELLF